MNRQTRDILALEWSLSAAKYGGEQALLAMRLGTISQVYFYARLSASHALDFLGRLS